MLLEKYSEFWILKSVLLHTINWFINRQKEKNVTKEKGTHKKVNMLCLEANIVKENKEIF